MKRISPPDRPLPPPIELAAILLFGTAIAGFPVIAFLPDVLNVPSRLITIPFRAVVLALSVILTLYAFHTRRFTAKLPVILALTVFWTLYLFRIFIDVGVYRLPLIRPGWEYLVYSIGICLTPMLGLMIRLPRRTLDLSVFTIWAFSLASSILAILNLDRMTAVGRLRAADALNPITLGHQGVMLTVLSLFILLTFRTKLYTRIIAFVALLLGLFQTGIAGSRSPILTLIILALMILWYGAQGKRFGKLIIISAPLIATIPWVIRKTVAYGSSTIERIEQTLETAGADESRLFLWEVSWNAFRENPIFGYSLDPPIMNYPHNLLIESFMTTGIFGGTAFSILVLLGAFIAIKLIFHRSPQAWLGLLFLQALVYASFSGAIYSHTFFWCTLGGVLGAYRFAFPSRVHSASLMRQHHHQYPTRRTYKIR